MSCKMPITMSRQQFERQQEKLRIARQALARVEAKYARKRHARCPIEPSMKTRAQPPRAEP
jgi:hypothetical protein